jgi:hypothetical protein
VSPYTRNRGQEEVISNASEEEGSEEVRQEVRQEEEVDPFLGNTLA